MPSTVTNKVTCFHCGDICDANPIVSGDKYFCCTGCKSVYDILNQNDLCDYYAYNEAPGNKQKLTRSREKFAFLENVQIAAQFVEFSSAREVRARFYLPHIHCSSCLWLLENLPSLHAGIRFTMVEFERKEVVVSFDPKQITIRQVAELLADIGYEPYFSPNNENIKDTGSRIQRTRLIKIGIAGFCFANIMLLSFPEYLGFETLTMDGLSPVVFRYLNLILSLPVLFYSGTEFFVNAWHSIKQKVLNIDAPIALALAVTFLRSLYEVITATGSGYFDSLSGIIFFMLVGRAFQNKTYSTLKFNRDYTSYFPIAVCQILDDGSEVYRRIQDVREKNKIRIHNNEIVPVDGIVIGGKAEMDYSFVTGENELHPVGMGEIVYAGGRQKQGNIDLLVVKEFSQSKFTRLWNDDIFKKAEKEAFSFVTTISKYFSICVISLALGAFVFWQFQNPARAWNALTAVLIVACPCALLLATTFTQGFILNIFSKYGFYIKNGNVLQNLSRAKHIVFDKTGTITLPAASHVSYMGTPLAKEDSEIVAAMFSQSMHPLSRAINNTLPISVTKLEHFKEVQQGLEAWVNDVHYKIGSAHFAGAPLGEVHGSEVWIARNNVVLGKFVVSNILRENIAGMLQALKPRITVLSGDNSNSREYLEAEISRPVAFKFNQTPEDKLHFIGALQQKDDNVIMVGDGLNDAGALKKSDIGIAVVENTMQFSPACEGILVAEKLPLLHRFIAAAGQSRNLIILTFIISVMYNVVGLYFSVTAQLSPLIAAILMPMSTVSIVLVTMLGSRFIEATNLKKRH